MSKSKIIEFASRTQQTQTESQTSATAWPEPCGETATPAFTWQQLERQLLDLAATPGSKALVSSLVSAVRKQAHFKPPEMVLREILCLAWTLLDEEFCSGSEAEMT